MGDALDTADPLALEEQVCFALSVAARGVSASTARCSSRWG